MQLCRYESVQQWTVLRPDTAAVALSVRAFAPQAEGWVFKSQLRQN